MEEYVQQWKLRDDGIYHTKFPKDMTMSFLARDMTTVTENYSEHTKDNVIRLKVLIDASEVESCPEMVIIAFNNAVVQYPESKAAIYGESKIIKNVLDNYCQNNNLHNNLKRFATKEESIEWLNN